LLLHFDHLISVEGHKHHASGWLAECHDDQGVAFDLWQPTGDY